MRFTVYSAPVAHLLSFLVFTSSFGLADKNCVAKVYIPSFFLARSSLSVQAKISTLGFQLSVEILAVKPCRKSRDTLQSDIILIKPESS